LQVLRAVIELSGSVDAQLQAALAAVAARVTAALFSGGGDGSGDGGVRQPGSSGGGMRADMLRAQLAEMVSALLNYLMVHVHVTQAGCYVTM
jgi:hypothetical protein